MEYMLLITLSVLGAAFITGGVVGYRKSNSTRGKAISAAFIAAGVVMLAILLIVTPVSVSVETN